VVQALVNSVDIESGQDDLTTPASVHRWLVERRLLAVEADVTGADMASVIRLREALRQLLLGNNGDDGDRAPARTVLDDVAAAGDARLRFADTHVHLDVVAGGVAGALAKVAVAVADSMGEGTWIRLKACREDTCQWAFYDKSKNHSGSWCDMAVCGSRVKMRRYRNRRKAQPG
jgi:predicted RNA-binding Zn ribbon-like protein